MTPRLHILNKAPDHPRYRQCLEALEAGDALVLMESGVLGLKAKAPLTAATVDNVQVYAIDRDLAACSPESEPVPPEGVETIDHYGLIELVCRIGSPVSW